MKLSRLIENLPLVETLHFQDLEILGITNHSEEVKPGNLFVAIVGTKTDGHRFIDQVIQRGAAAVVVEKEIAVPSSIPLLKVKDTRAALSHLAATWYGRPSREMVVVGVTGTNGKTTITLLLESILNGVGIKAGRIGTLGLNYPNRSRTLSHTTPESTEIQHMLREMAEQKVKTVVMEVSSHAVDMHRADDIQFDLAIFTNLTPEHLDYHKSMELYFESKKKLFSKLLPKGKGLKRAILNVEDPYGLKLLDLAESYDSVWTYTTRPQSKWNLFAQEWRSDLAGMRGVIATPEGVMEFSSSLIGLFNLSNIIAATAAGLSLGVPLKKIQQAIEEFPGAPGRLERIPNRKDLHIFVDYAHTPDALKNVLKTLKDLEAKQITTVFGCGGDRDRTKRPIMGREVARFSDQAIITNDNPRTEDPRAIVEEILPGIQEGGMTLERNCFIELDRRKAIQMGLEKTPPGGVLLVAGKGHEDYQILGSKRIHFDDREVIREILNNL